MSELKPGLLEDTRPQTEKEKDFKAEELFATFTAPKWTEKKPATWRRYIIFDQDGSSSCVAQAVTKALGIENAQEEGEFVHLSARDIYTQRANKPGEGMIYVDAMNIASKKGATLEALMPSQKMGETAMNTDYDRKPSKAQVAQVYKAGGYVQLPFDIDTIAGTLEQGNPVLLGFRFTYAEWTDIPTMGTATPTLGHAVCAVDYTLYKGKKYIVIEDSWGKFGQFAGQRLISEEFLTKRCKFAGYFLDLKNNWRDLPTEQQPTRPTSMLVTPLAFGQKSEAVKNLQAILQYEQLFPLTQELTGYYGAITARGVAGFQKRYNLTVTDGKTLDGATIAKINEVYN